MLSDKNLRSRPPGQNSLPLESWYKLRNIILISGNIATPEAIRILEGFVSDPDPRIAEEVILALEKIKSEKSCDMLTSYLYFNDGKIRYRAAVALGNIGDDRYLNKLIDAFGNESEMKYQMIPIIARLGREKALPFFRQLLLGQKESAWKSLLGKSGDDMKMHILSALIKIPSQKTLKLLDDYKSGFNRGLGSLFKNNNLMVAVEDTRRAVLKKINT
jgi:HEAT repeat protein